MKSTTRRRKKGTRSIPEKKAFISSRKRGGQGRGIDVSDTAHLSKEKN